MRFTPCKDCDTSVIHMANICNKSGSATKHRLCSLRYMGWGLILFFGLSIISACEKTNKPEMRTASMKSDTPTATNDTEVAAQNRYSPPGDPMYPFKLITILQEDVTFGGMHCRLKLDGKGWHKSKFDGIWNATLRRSFGPNEVSCLLESTDISSVQRVELEAEFYKVGFKEAEILMQFSQSAQVLMHPSTPPFEFAEAVVNKREWSNEHWTMTKLRYKNGGYGLMLKRNGGTAPTKTKQAQTVGPQENLLRQVRLNYAQEKVAEAEQAQANGQLREAIALYKQAAELDPESQQIKQKLTDVLALQRKRK